MKAAASGACRTESTSYCKGRRSVQKHPTTCSVRSQLLAPDLWGSTSRPAPPSVWLTGAGHPALGGRLNNGPPEPLGRIVVPFKDSLDVLARIPEDAEAGTYAFFAQQWEVGVDEQGKPAGLPAYPGGSWIYVSRISTLVVGPHVDEGKEVTSLLEEWLADESGYDEETWPELKQALDQDRPSDRKLFID
jgi:hypothetical protein